ncbi:MAG: LysE family transporter [Rhodobacterales bacterium]|nr:LysE family transporter [Rhodobacterales bacterium]
MLSATALAALLTGFGVGASLVLSIGPQNLHLIRAGAHAGRAWVIATVGYCSEIVIFLAAVAWLAVILNRAPEAVLALYALGIAFLLWCGLRTLRRRDRRPDSVDPAQARSSLRREVLGMLSVTWFNPLVYLEVGLVAGTLAISQESSARAAFAAGFLGASALRFYGWSTIGQRLGPWLGQGARMTWFNTGSGIALILLAASMAWHGLAHPTPT